METDKQLYRVFGAQPAWVFELAGLPPVGKCAMLDCRTKPWFGLVRSVVLPDEASSKRWKRFF